MAKQNKTHAAVRIRLLPKRKSTGYPIYRLIKNAAGYLPGWDIIRIGYPYYKNEGVTCFGPRQISLERW